MPKARTTRTINMTLRKQHQKAIHKFLSRRWHLIGKKLSHLRHRMAFFLGPHRPNIVHSVRSPVPISYRIHRNHRQPNKSFFLFSPGPVIFVNCACWSWDFALPFLRRPSHLRRGGVQFNLDPFAVCVIFNDNPFFPKGVQAVCGLRKQLLVMLTSEFLSAAADKDARATIAVAAVESLFTLFQEGLESESRVIH